MTSEPLGAHNARPASYILNTCSDKVYLAAVLHVPCLQWYSCLAHSKNPASIPLTGNIQKSGRSVSEVDQAHEVSMAWRSDKLWSLLLSGYPLVWSCHAHELMTVDTASLEAGVVCPGIVFNEMNLLPVCAPLSLVARDKRG